MEFSSRTTAAVFVLAVLTVLGHWNIWAHGVDALGWNSTVAWLTTLSLLWFNRAERSFRRDRCWLLPLIAIAVSYSVFENPWLKLISCFVLPAATGIFFAYAQLGRPRQPLWDLALTSVLLKRTAGPFRQLSRSFSFVVSRPAVAFGKANNSLMKRVMRGVLLLVPVAILVSALLASADEKFANLYQNLVSEFFALISWSVALKMAWMIVVATLVFATLHSWRKPLAFEQPGRTAAMDDVVVGIVIGGVLFIYLVFLYLQIDYLTVGVLPSDFAQVERLVKSGFWQLFFLSILNIGLFLLIYNNIGGVALLLLRVFVAASGLLLISAAWRMGLYVYWYGLSYEKFFASYTTVFALVVFVYLLVASFLSRRRDVFRFIAFAALGAYSIATLLPVEKVIFHSNLRLAKIVDSRVHLRDLKHLSLDIVGDVERELGRRPSSQLLTAGDGGWSLWLRNKKNRRCRRAWYEWRLSLELVDTSCTAPDRTSTN